MNIDSNVRADECIGNDLYDAEGDKIGEIVDVYLDDDTDRPEWFAVRTGFFGTRVSFVPIEGGAFRDDELHVEFTKHQVKDSPHVEADGRLSEEEEAELYRHYGRQYGEPRSGDRAEGSPAPEHHGRDDAMTRSEEELDVGTRREATGTARLRKWVETEHQTVTVPVRRERAEMVTEPITDANRDRAMSGPDITENVHEETLYAEEPVVEKRVEPKERVRIEKHSDSDDREVAADLRKERIELDTDAEVDADVRR